VPSSRPQAPTGSSHTRSAADRMNRNDPTEASVPTARSTATPRIPRRLAICPAQGQPRPIWVEESPTTRVSTAPSRRSKRGVIRLSRAFLATAGSSVSSRGERSCCSGDFGAPQGQSGATTAPARGKGRGTQNAEIWPSSSVGGNVGCP
jgi:hypothetical protein